MFYIVHHNGKEDPPTANEVEALCAVYDYQQTYIESWMEMISE